MTDREVMLECLAIQRGFKQNLSQRCAKAIAAMFTDGSEEAEAFLSTGEMHLRYDKLYSLFFPIRKRSESEWLISTVFYDYLYSRRKRPGPPIKNWSKL